MLTHAGVHCRVSGLPCVEAIDVAVVHAEGGGDEDGVVNLKVGCACDRAFSTASEVTDLLPVVPDRRSQGAL